MYGHELFALAGMINTAAMIAATAAFMAIYFFQRTWIRFEDESSTALGKITWRLGPALFGALIFMWIFMWIVLL